MIDLTRITAEPLSNDPYRWGFIDRLFTPADAEVLVNEFPRDHFKTVKGYDGEKGYQYEARSLIGMGAQVPSYAKDLSGAWLQLAKDLLSPAYRTALTQLSGLDVASLPMEANISHYGPKAWLGPHVDLEDKLLTQVFYFNDVWDTEDGGCLTILRQTNKPEVVRTIPPLIGNSVVLVRSANSWHAVSAVRDSCRTSRRSLAVTFYRPGSLSTMWPEGDNTPLHSYDESPLSQWLQEKWQRFARRAGR